MTIEEEMKLKERLHTASEIQDKIIAAENLMDLIQDNMSHSGVHMCIEVDDGKHSYCLHGEDIFEDLNNSMYMILCARKMRLQRQYNNL